MTEHERLICHTLFYGQRRCDHGRTCVSFELFIKHLFLFFFDLFIYHPTTSLAHQYYNHQSGIMSASDRVK